MDSSFVILQSERRQFRARGPVIRVKNASNPKTFSDLDEHRGVFDRNYLPGWRLGDVQRKPKDVRVRLSQVDEAGGKEKNHEPIKLELSNLVRIQFPCFVADHDNLQSIPCLKPADQLDHFGIWLRPGKHNWIRGAILQSLYFPRNPLSKS
jgi:hypothetical protein